MKLRALLMWSTCGLFSLTGDPVSVARDDAGEANDFEPAIWGIHVPVPTIAPAVEFYTEVLEFEADGYIGQDSALLRIGEFHLWLSLSERTLPVKSRPTTEINFRVPDLERASAAVEAAGGSVSEIEDFPLGRFVNARDPWGNTFGLLRITVGDAAELADIGIFNVGLTSTSYSSIEPFLVTLGFEVFSRKYLPTALPFRVSGASELVAHDGAEHSARANDRHNALLLTVPDIDDALKALGEKGVVEGGKPRPSPFGRVAKLRSPAGLELRLIERSAAQLGFERIRSLSGTWRGKSTAGWDARVGFEVIAGGSVILQRSDLGAHPGETMVTAYHRDGARLVLTHYCVAGNQPTMEAREYSDNSIAFVFSNATNLRSRDEGHMDAARFTFEDPDHFHSRWSWYQNGKESWMEEILYERD